MFKVIWVKEIKKDGKWFLTSGNTIVEAKSENEAYWKMRYEGLSVTGVENYFE